MRRGKVRYSQAAGLFYYARILNKNWRAEGLNDDYLVLVSDLGKSESLYRCVRMIIPHEDESSCAVTQLVL